MPLPTGDRVEARSAAGPQPLSSISVPSMFAVPAVQAGIDDRGDLRLAERAHELGADVASRAARRVGCSGMRRQLGLDRIRAIDDTSRCRPAAGPRTRRRCRTYVGVVAAEPGSGTLASVLIDGAARISLLAEHSVPGAVEAGLDAGRLSSDDQRRVAGLVRPKMPVWVTIVATSLWISASVRQTVHWRRALGGHVRRRPPGSSRRGWAVVVRAAVRSGSPNWHV